MKNLFAVAVIILSGLILAPTCASAAGIVRPQPSKARVSKNSLIVLAAHGRRECRDDNGNSYNCAR